MGYFLSDANCISSSSQSCTTGRLTSRYRLASRIFPLFESKEDRTVSGGELFEEDVWEGFVNVDCCTRAFRHGVCWIARVSRRDLSDLVEVSAWFR